MRRVRRPGDPAPSPVQQVRERRPPRTVVPTDQVSVTLVITAKIVRGTVPEEEFAKWMQEAVHSYHRFRNGWVGIGAIGGINVPEVIVADES